MYVFGGVTDMRMNTRTNQVFKIWLRVPKLKEICWEALLHYQKQIRFMSGKELVGRGVPPEYAKLAHPAPPCGLGPETSDHWASDLMQSRAGGEEKVSRLELNPVAISY